jgi:hypothetical protein
MVRNCPDTGDAGSLVRTLGGVLAVTTMAGEPSTRILADASPLQYVFVSQAIMDHRLRTIRNARAAVVVCFEPRSSNDAFAKMLRANDSVSAAI